MFKDNLEILDTSTKLNSRRSSTSQNFYSAKHPYSSSAFKLTLKSGNINLLTDSSAAKAAPICEHLKKTNV